MALGRWIVQIQTVFHAIPRTAALSVVGPAALLVLAYLSWSYWGAEKFDLAIHSLRMENLKVTPQPVWIKTNVTEEVYRMSFLKNVSLLDRNAASTIAHAFDVHPWVRTTTRVMKLSGGEVQVDLEYRRPIALVILDPSSPLVKQKVAESREVGTLGAGISSKMHLEPGGSGGSPYHYLPIDIESVLLPCSQEYAVEDYLLIYARNATTKALVGQKFGDSRIEEAVRLCTLLSPLRRELNLFRIYAYEKQLAGGKTDIQLEVATWPSEVSEERQAIWGHGPGSEVPGENDYETKVRLLHKFFKSAPNGTHSIDISGLQRR